MADMPTTSGVGRPKGATKVGRPRSKSAQKPKAKGSSKKTATPTKQAVRPILQLEGDMVQTNQRQFGDQLPDLPPLDLEQDLPVGEENQQHQAEEPNLPPEPEELDKIGQPNQPPNQPNQPPNQVQNLPAAMAPLQQLNWSYFKPEFSGKPDEDAEEHLLRTNDWMETHNFPDDQKVRRFCLTLMGEARLWYETLGTAQLDWETFKRLLSSTVFQIW